MGIAQPARRRFLEASAAAAVGTWLGSGETAFAVPGPGETLLRTVPFVDEGGFPLETTFGAGLGRRRGLDLGTLTATGLEIPQERFFIRTGAPDHLPSAERWTVRVHGLVRSPIEIPLGELTRQAEPMGSHLLECAGNSRAAHFGLISAARWTGVPLQRVLDRAGPTSRATQVLVSGFDEHAVGDPGSVPGASWIFRLDQVRQAGAFLATGMNGGPLAPDHGHPLRLVVPGWYGCTAIKWVNEIALLDDTAPATDHMREYAGRTHQGSAAASGLARGFQPATLDPAAVAVRVEGVRAPGTGITYRVSGILWGARVDARALRIRFRPGQALVPVESVHRGPESPWGLWSHAWTPRAPGRYRIELALAGGAVRTRRLAMGFYAREVDIPAV